MMTVSGNVNSAAQPIKPPELVNGEFKDFIGVWNNFVPPGVCNRWIKYFEETMSKSSVHFDDNVLDGTEQFSTGSAGRKDLSVLFSNVSSVRDCNEVNQYLQACLESYLTEFSYQRTVPMISTDIKLQKTEEGGGYHVWHYESGSYHTAFRELVWMIYLNDVTEEDSGGETEFFYQKRRIKPTTGTVVIWPAAFTHLHRGNMLLKGTKYIMTGWYYKLLF